MTVEMPKWLKSKNIIVVEDGKHKLRAETMLIGLKESASEAEKENFEKEMNRFMKPVAKLVFPEMKNPYYKWTGEVVDRARTDAEDEEDTKNHGNTRIPYGLCKREGIEVQPGWTPKDAWDALAGKGVNAKDIYKQLKETGKVGAGQGKQNNEEKRKKTLETVGRYIDSKKKIRDAEVELTFEDSVEKDEKRLIEAENNVKAKRKELDGLFGGKTAKEAYEEQASAKAEMDVIYKELDELDEKRYSEMTREEKLRKLDLKDKKKEVEDRFYNAWKVINSYSDVEREEGTLNSERERLEEKKQKIEEAKKTIESEKRNVDGFRKELSEYAATNLKSWDDCETGEDVQIKAAAHSGENGDKETATENVAQVLNSGNVAYKKPVKRSTAISEDEIISTISGGDKTEGSCASVAFAYVANKAGYEVEDFRDGKSREAFSRNTNDLLISYGAKETKNEDGNQVLAALESLGEVEEGKEYYFTAGRHASIVRMHEGNLEFLELQSDDVNGWKPLDSFVLEWRFGCVENHAMPDGSAITVSSCLLDVEELAKKPECIAMTGFINTAREEQAKGRGGHER